MHTRNSYKSRKDESKAGPSGMSRNEAFSLPESWGGLNCLMPVDINVIWEMKEALGGDAILEFVLANFAQHAQDAYDTLNIADLTLKNVWYVFRDLFPILFPWVITTIIHVTWHIFFLNR